jgi:tetratricopeptide (TPR) repeat protein
MSMAVREVAEENNVPLIDFVELIEDESDRKYGHTISGDEFFLDHVHTTVEGYRLLGLSLLNELVKQGIAKTGPQWNDRAIAAVTQKVEQSHNNSKMRIRSLDNLASTMNWSGMFEETDNLLLRSLQSEKDDKNKGLIYDILGRLSLKRGNIDKAIEYWYKALPSWPDSMKLRSVLADLLQKKGRLEEALTENHEILRIFDDRRHKPRNAEVDEHDPITIENIVKARIDMAQMLSLQGRAGEAIVHYSEALKLRPDEALVHIDMGILFAKEGQETESISHLVAGLKINPESAKAHLHLGMIMNEQGRLDEAIAHYSEVLKIEPDSAEGHNNLGVVFAKQGKLDKAVDYFSRVVRINPGFADAHYNLGRALAMQGRREESQFYFSEAQRLNAASAARNGGMKH